MESLMILIPLSVIIVAVAIGSFLWAVNNGQYDEPERDARRALADGDETVPHHETAQHGRLGSLAPVEED